MTDQREAVEKALTGFVAGAERLAALARGLSDKDLDRRRAPGEWSIRTIIHHLADDGDVWSMAIKRAVAAPEAFLRFEGFPGNEAWAAGLRFEARAVGPALELIVAHRHYVAALVRAVPGAWERSIRLLNAQGDVRREMRVGEMVPMLTAHLVEHLAEIEAILQQ